MADLSFSGKIMKLWLQKKVSDTFSHLGSPNIFDQIRDTYLVCVVSF